MGDDRLFQNVYETDHIPTSYKKIIDETNIENFENLKISYCRDVFSNEEIIGFLQKIVHQILREQKIGRKFAGIFYDLFPTRTRLT